VAGGAVPGGEPQRGHPGPCLGQLVASEIAEGRLDRARAAGKGRRRAGRPRLLRAPLAASTALRFFSSFPNLDSAVAWATEVDFQRRYGLVATGDGGRVLAHAGWEREPDRPERAEVAFAIADAMQGKGLGTILLGQLAEAADAPSRAARAVQGRAV
jgi:GNAT superfamily N-acetyltransferase